MFELKLPTEYEREEFKKLYMTEDDKVDWKKFNEDIKKDLMANVEKSRRWQEWTIAHHIFVKCD